MLALIVEDNDLVRRSLARLVEEDGFTARTASSLGAAREELHRWRPDVVLLDLGLPDGDGLALVGELEGESRVDVVVITGRPEVESAVASFRAGAVDYLGKPVDGERVHTILARIRRTLAAQREPGRSQACAEIVGSSPAMQSVYDQLARVAPTAATVLLVGETGVGKEVAATALHRLSGRAGPFKALNCAALQSSLSESELFGHERGSFTGAVRRRRGVFECAGAGTLMLDEITEMSPEIQGKLLRTLETKTFRRVGGNEEVRTDARLVAATNRSPEEAVRNGELRKDLYYRLNVVQIRIPPLRERAEDVGLLAAHFVDQLEEESGASKRLTAGALEALHSRDWPGNVRELRNCIERAFILAPDEIGAGHVASPDGAACIPPDGNGHTVARIGMSLADAARELTLATLRHNVGNKTKTAAMLGISLKTLYNRLHEYGRMPPPSPVPPEPRGSRIS